MLASTGLLVVVLAPSCGEQYSLPMACIGFAITGCGLSTLIPTMFSTAGHLPGVHAGSSIARVAFFTYCGSIIASPLIGALSDAFDSLRAALLVCAVLLSFISPLGIGIPPEDTPAKIDQPKHGDVNADSKTITTPLLKPEHAATV
jgi:MFS family permease